MADGIEDAFTRLSLGATVGDAELPTLNSLSRQAELLIIPSFMKNSPYGDANVEKYAVTIEELLGIVEHNYHNIIRVVNIFRYDSYATRPAYQIRVILTDQELPNGQSFQLYDTLLNYFSIPAVLEGQIIIPIYVQIAERLSFADPQEPMFLHVKPADFQNRVKLVATEILNAVAERIHGELYVHQWKRWDKLRRTEVIRDTFFNDELQPFERRRRASEYPKWRQLVNRVDFQEMVQPIGLHEFPKAWIQTMELAFTALLSE
jgi:hypothetical protein